VTFAAVLSEAANANVNIGGLIGALDAGGDAIVGRIGSGEAPR
jgi:hypothetical protein